MRGCGRRKKLRKRSGTYLQKEKALRIPVSWCCVMLFIEILDVAGWVAWDDASKNPDNILSPIIYIMLTNKHKIIKIQITYDNFFVC